MSEICRLCLSNSGEFHHLSETRKNLPLSVISMIICPVTIEIDDALSQLICDQCLQVVLNAYNLRVISMNSERILREQEAVKEFHIVQEEEFHAEEEEELSTEERPYDENFVVYEPQDDNQQQENAQQIIENLSEIFPYHVDCQRSEDSNRKSVVWNYFGYLKENGKLVETEKKSYFCKICVEENQNLKPKYKIESIATSVLFFHLEKVHGILKSELHEILPNSAGIAGNELSSCDICAKSFHLASMNLHSAIEHENGELMRTREKMSNYRVHCFKQSSKSLAWEYFGKLLDENETSIDEHHYYCRLCVEEKCNLQSKYTTHTSTSILLQHLRNSHAPKSQIENPKKRKRIINSMESVCSSLKKLRSEEFSCKYCNEKFEFKKTLNRHLAKDHGEEQTKFFACTHEGCNKSFTLRDTLSKHIKSIHEEVEKYPCDQCPSILSTRMSLQRHINTCHLKLKAFICELCNATFTELKSLKNHERKLHMGIDDKNIQCDKCDLKFANQWSLNRHHLSHTKEKPHSCHLCKFSYGSKGDLVKHITKVHGDAVYKCEKCSEGFQYRNELRDHYRVHYINVEEEEIEEIQEIHEFDEEVITEELLIG